MMTLQEWIRAEKAEGRYWTQEIIASRIGVHATTLNKALMGHVEPRIGLVKRISELTRGAVGLYDWPNQQKRPT